MSLYIEDTCDAEREHMHWVEHEFIAVTVLGMGSAHIIIVEGPFESILKN